MRGLLSAAGRSFLRAFVASVLVLAPGVLAAPNLDQSKALGVAALIASISAALKAIQVFIPQLSLPFGAYSEIANSFARAFIAAFVVAFVGVLDAPELDFSKAAITAVIVGALTAAIRAVQGAFTPGDFPAPQQGFAVAEDPPSVQAAR